MGAKCEPDQAWVRSLYERGEPKRYTGDELRWLAMPCGGVGAGQIEICGDGKLGSWWIANEPPPTNGGISYAGGNRYLNPFVPERPVDHGFALRIDSDDRQVYPLDHSHFDALDFTGQYPVARLNYRRSAGTLPVEIESEVFSPFVPLSVRDSANPGTLFRISVCNTSEKTIRVQLGGWLENGVFRLTPAGSSPVVDPTVPGAGSQLADSGVPDGVRLRNRVQRQNGCCMALMEALVSDDADRRRPQFGSLAIGLLDDAGYAISCCSGIEGLWDGSGNADTAECEFGESLIGGVACGFSLEPGERQTRTFVISWYFPNLENREKGCPGYVGRIYNNWYESAADVVEWFAREEPRLVRETKTFQTAYYENSTLPHWLLERMVAPLTNLASHNVTIWESGRMYAYEGVNFCLGTCGHVYNFVAAIACLFPELERSVRRMQDLALAYDPASGRVNFRGADGTDPELTWAYASDAQSGYVLKLYREHLMSTDSSFLDEVWPKVKRIIGFHIFMDGSARGVPPNGVLEGIQTFWDPMWYGPNPYNQTLYLAALRAAEEMARLQGEGSLADRYRALFESGSRWMDEHMWDGDHYAHLYPSGFMQARDNGATAVVSPQAERELARGFVDAFNRGDPNYQIGGCNDAQQLFGQNWAHRLGMGYILPPERCRTAAESIFRYNWAPDISQVYDSHPPKTRTLAAPGEAALVNGRWPHRERQAFENTHDKDDVWTGLEYEAACDMINEGLIDEALVVVRSIHERYDARKRNPFNEIEGAEHYSRAMQSWNVLLSLSGFQVDGPSGKIGFAPKISPQQFACFFSAPEGWGSFRQEIGGAQQTATLSIAYGQLRMQLLELQVPERAQVKTVGVTLDGAPVEVTVQQTGARLCLELKEPLSLAAGILLKTVVTYSEPSSSRIMASK